MTKSIQELDVSYFPSGTQLALSANHLWLIISGVVKSYTVSEQGSAITLGFWGAKDVVGQPFSHIAPFYLKCIGEVQAIAIPRSHWTEVSQNLFFHAQQTQQLTYIVRNTRISKRLWLCLKWLGNKFGRAVEQGRLIDFQLTHQELADAINTTRITVTKTLSIFEQEGRILRPRTKCIILKNHI